MRGRHTVQDDVPQASSPAASEEQAADRTSPAPVHIPEAAVVTLMTTAQEVLGDWRYGGLWREGNTMIVAYVDHVTRSERARLQDALGDYNLALIEVEWSLESLREPVAELEAAEELAGLHFSVHVPDNVVVAQAEDVEDASHRLAPWAGRPIRVTPIPQGVPLVDREPTDG